MTTEESMKDEHLALAFECNRQLRAENEALRKDAERYRYLRSLWKVDHFSTEVQPDGDPNKCDSAIDAAMQPIPCTTAEQSKP